MCGFLDDPKVPIHLLIYAMQTAVTTATCIAEYLSWSGLENAEKLELGKLYVPYLAVCESHLPLLSCWCSMMLICCGSGLHGCGYVHSSRRRSEQETSEWIKEGKLRGWLSRVCD